MANNTWTGLSQKDDERWEQLYDEYVPSMGAAPTVGGEILRAMDRIIYRFYNDGDMAGIGYGNETCNSSDRYLCDTVPEYRSLDGVGEDKYEEATKRNHRICFAHLMTHLDLFEKENTDDSSTPSEEDYRREREDEREDWGEEY